MEVQRLRRVFLLPAAACSSPERNPMIETLDGKKETVNFQEIKGFKFYDNKDYESYPAHWHSPVEILMPLQNTYKVTCNNIVYNLCENDILFINSGVIHSMTALAGERLIFQAEFSLLQPIFYIESSSSLLPPVLHVTAADSPEIHAKLSELLIRIRDEYLTHPPFAGASIYSMLANLFVLIGRSHADTAQRFMADDVRQRKYVEKFMAVCSYIDEHCTDNLTLDDAAEYSGFSKYHFTRLFRQFTGFTFYRYLNQKRIAMAERILADPTLSVTDVAMASGFSSMSAFIRMFKIMKGCTPSEFRKMYRPTSRNMEPWGEKQAGAAGIS